MNNPEDGGRQSEEPVIAIYRHPYRPGIYRVEVEGKEIERLRSFEVMVRNDPTQGTPAYRVEQYLPRGRSGKLAEQNLPGHLRQDRERRVESGADALLES